MTLRVAAIILAAGNSSRIGRPKQLLEYQGKPLLLRAVESADEAGLAPIVVVTREAGSDVNEIRTALGGQDVKWVENSIWARGMGSSLRAGLDFLLRADESLDAVMLLVCDQPLVTAAHLRSLVDEITNSGKSMVAAGYDGTVGVPAIVSRNYFNELASLPEDGGAKVLFRRFPEAVAVMPLPEAKVDVDNPAAYRFLLRGGAT